MAEVDALCAGYERTAADPTGGSAPLVVNVEGGEQHVDSQAREEEPRPEETLHKTCRHQRDSKLMS